MKQAIKVLEKRIEILGKEWDKKDAEFDNCEMVCDHEFLQNDLANIVGLKSRASEILNRKRKLSLEMIRQLHEQLNIPTDVLIQAY